MGSTSISWTDATWNPVRGCSRVSPGCDHCYAMHFAHRFSKPGKPYAGLTTIRKGVDWTGNARFVPEMLSAPLRWRKPRRIFVNSMSDLFHPSITNEQIAAVFGVMAACPWHTFQVLTKRAERMRQWFAWLDAQQTTVDFSPLTTVLDAGCRLSPDGARRPGVTEELRIAIRERCGWPLPNVWLGISAENQKHADERWHHLSQVDAAVRFISAEPLIAPLSIAGWATLPDWLIVGGESGPRARAFDLAWARSLRDQCKAAGTSFFMKQMGARPIMIRLPEWHESGGSWSVPLCAEDGRWRVLTEDRAGADPAEWPEDLRVQEFPR